MHALTREKLRYRISELGQAAIRARFALEPISICDAAKDATTPPLPTATDWQQLSIGQHWGHKHGCVWLYGLLTVPLGWSTAPLELCLIYPELPHDETLIGLEANLYLDGRLFAGIDRFHRHVLLPQAICDGKPHNVALLVYTREPLLWQGIELWLRDPTIWQLHRLMVTLFAAAETFPAESQEAHWLLAALNQAYNCLDLREGWHADALANSASAALAALQQAIDQPDTSPRPQVIASGHAHMDVAWLWPLWRTQQKVAHTVATALMLMDRYPNYHFSMSQPQTFAMLKQNYPELYARLRERVREGRFEPVGAMWVEADCNLTSGESLIRQILHGTRFFADEFGIEPTVCWLPDAFGYSAALPQILCGCGIYIFLTTKLSWNQTNTFPHDTFRWQGIDGSSVLAHMITAPWPLSPTQTTYNGDMNPTQVAGLWRRYRQHTLNQTLLYLFGHGDGGGGPTEAMLADAAILADLPGFPQVQLGRAEEMLRNLYTHVWGNESLPTWVGELYLEYHRGTYTSQGRMKQANRQSEILYRETEWLAVWAAQINGDPVKLALYQQQLDEGWRLILLNQFHDILPGSSIAEVYRDAEAQYAQVQAIGNRIAQESLATIASQVDLWRESLIFWNSLPWERIDVAEVELPISDAPPALLSNESEPLAVQILSEKQGMRRILIGGTALPSYGYAAYDLLAGGANLGGVGLEANERRIESPHMQLVFNEHGEIARLYDKRIGREVLLEGQTGNQLVAFEDRPLKFDAWDIDPFFEEKAYPLDQIVSWRVVEQGPVRAAIEIVRRYGHSTITQRIGLYHSLPRVDIITEIDWHEHQTLLKAVFPLAINATSATCEIQFGAIERPVHRNTTWDEARFEVCAHRWVDLSEGGYGVALLNNGKYGHDIRGSTLRLTLLKSGVFPDPTADQGLHTFTYALLPHIGDWRQGQVVRRAYELNAPLRATLRRPGRGFLPRTGSFLRCNADHVVVETVKAAQNGDGIIVRLYEAHNQRGPLTLSFAQPLASAEECNMREHLIQSLPVEGTQLRLRIRPFEVKTLRVRFLNA